MSKIKGVDNVMITRSMIDSKDGKVDLVPVDGNGPKIRRWPIDAKEIVTQGKYKLAGAPTKEELSSGQGTNDEEESPSASSVKPEVETKITVPDDGPEFDYDVPDTAPKQK